VEETPHVTIEYVIMVPLLILQIFLFPLSASWLMNVWVDSRRSLALQDAASHLGSTMQQLYFSLNHGSISKGTVTYTPGLPPFIESSHYVGTAVLRTVSNSTANSTKILDLTLSLIGTGSRVTTSVIMGPNVLWQDSTFVSNSTHACVSATKDLTDITMRFGE
jgi:hypothetical protein